MPSVPNNWRCSVIKSRTEIITEEYSVTGRKLSVRGRRSGFLNDNRDPNQPGLGDLHKRIGNVHVCCEHCTAERSGRVDGIGSGCIDSLDMMFRARNRDARRIGVYLHDLLSAREIARHPRPDLYFPCGTGIEPEMQLAGYDLHHLDFPRMPYLV